jgi:peptidoglycan/xylan/chitin deacetylase (PgdA/CDA1 family)
MNAARIPVLMYHRVGHAHNAWERKYCVSPQRFSAHLHALARDGFVACAIDDFVAWLKGECALPEKSLLLTFDDGFLGVYDHALPVVRDLGWPAAVFLVSALIGKEDAWTRPENPSGATYPLLGKAEVARMARYKFAFHSHSRHHPRLPVLLNAQLDEELGGAREELQSVLGLAIRYIAYPYGVYDERVIEAARKAGYQGGFSVQPGFNRAGGDPFRICRLDIFGTDTPAQLLRKVRLGSNDGTLGHALGYYRRRVTARLGLASPS